jgi:starch phosphorylase
MKTSIAYFSMEIALEKSLKTYAGGLGVLAGDILRSASRKKFPMIGVTLLNKHGYFKQLITDKGKQEERIDKSDLSKLELLSSKFYLQIGADKVLFRAWRYFLQHDKGLKIPIYFLDTDWPENREKHRRLCENLYPGDKRKKLKQAVLLGRGGVKLLNKIGLEKISKIHLNEGHGALAAIELFLNSKKDSDLKKIKEVRDKLVFTTHTPIPAGHDVFFGEFLLKYQPDFPTHIEEIMENDTVNFTKLALFFSSYANGVSRIHGRVSRKMFPDYAIDYITNGVESSFWTAPEMITLFDNHIPDWRQNHKKLKKASRISLGEIKLAHLSAKQRLIKFIARHKKVNFSEDVLTITFARRFAPYKRPTMLLSDLDKLKEINKNSGPIQIIYAGKAHPNDEIGRTLISETNKRIKKIFPEIKIVFLENYDLEMAKLLVSGSDVWLNNPALPNEASATSGMKAAHNGIPQISTFDGWWPEGYVRKKTGWTINEAPDLYEILEKKVLPLYYHYPEKWLKMMRATISLNASYFNTDRVLNDYIKKAYS